MVPIANRLDRVMPRVLAAIIAELVAVAVLVFVVAVFPSLIAGLGRVATSLPTSVDVQAAVQLVEEEQNFALDPRRISDRASLIAQEAEARRTTVEHEAIVEAIRLEKLDERIAASPAAARHDLDARRLEVARAVAGNSRAVVSLGGNDLVADLLAAREATSTEPGPSLPTTPPQDATPAAPASEPATPAQPARTRSVGQRSRSRT